MRKRSIAAAVALPALLLSTAAHAVRPTESVVADEQPLEVAAGAPARAHRTVAWGGAPSAVAAGHWQRFLAAHGGWSAQWDADTGVPQRLWGQGIAAPGALKSAAIAEIVARTLLADHLALLAPGAAASDFELVSNVVHGGKRTVGFVQRAGGLRVIGGQISFLFKNDRVIVLGSEALPHVSVPSLKATAVALAKAPATASAWIGDLYQTRAIVQSLGELAILPIVRPGKAPEYRLVRTVEVASAAPLGRWNVYVDAVTGAAVARSQTLRFAEGTLSFNVPARNPAGTRTNFPAQFATVTAGSQTVTSDGNGRLTWNSGTSVQVKASGRYADVTVFDNAAPATATLTLAGGNLVWNEQATPTKEAQLAAYTFVNAVKQYAFANFDGELPWLSQVIPVEVNITEMDGMPANCNAYSTGDDIHFFAEGGLCNNTARIADVVYHEFGHSLHFNAIIAGAGFFDGAMSEGVSDYLAATIVNDAGMGRGFYRQLPNVALRNLDPTPDKVYPDNLRGEVHADGEIIAGTLWDLRKAMIQAHGQGPGVVRADDIYYAIIQRASDMTTAFVEAIAEDDDDGNLANGTPNLCLIQGVFAAHGLVHASPGFAGIEPPTRTGNVVSLTSGDPITAACQLPQISGVRVLWRLRGQTRDNTLTATRAGNTWSATIPEQADGSVVQYRFETTFSVGEPLEFPNNPGDKYYEFYVGDLAVAYCADFETEPTDWTTGASMGSNEWSWGAPTGAGGDPLAAFGGSKVFGTDLGGAAGRDGIYEPDSAVFATSPEVDVTGWTNVRLQYRRWLGSEDGFFDKASIEADGAEVWKAFASANMNAATTSHIDREWRFHDVDLSRQAADGKVKLTFRLTSDLGFELGGWTLDDVCVVGVPPGGVPDPECGDRIMNGDEECDDGNTTPGDGCSATCEKEEGGDDEGGTDEGGTDEGGTDEGGTDEGGTDEGGDDNAGTDDGGDGGGCCSTSRDAAGTGIAMSILVGLALSRRRRRA
jgi:cysteine-rich repeat protein